MKHPNRLTALLLGAAALLAGWTQANAENWAHWRGPRFDGSSPEKNLPATWSKTDNIAWAVDMPGSSAATPIIHEDRVFVSSTDSGTKTLVAFCLDRKTGKILWRNEVGTGLGHDNRSNYAASSPVTDGRRVVFFYGNGDTAAFDMSGHKLWSRNLQTDYGQFAFQWTFAASPTICRDKLYMEVLQRDVPANGRGRRDGPNESYLLAVDLNTGKDIWRHIRPSDAVAESREAYSTPIPFEHKGRAELLITGGDCITGHDPETGKELWRWGTWNPGKITHWRLVPSPVAGDGVILACAPKNSPVYAVKAGGSGVLDDSWIAWKSDTKREISSDVATPAFYDGDFFVLHGDRRLLSRVEPKSGNVKWSLEFPGRTVFQASPTVGDGKIYAMNFAGDVVVVDAAKGQLLQAIAMGDPGDDLTRSSISISQGQLFIRTNKRLYCVGKS